MATKVKVKRNSPRIEGGWRLTKLTLVVVVLTWMMPTTEAASPPFAPTGNGTGSQSAMMDALFSRGFGRGFTWEEETDDEKLPDDICASYCWGDLRCSATIDRSIKRMKKKFDKDISDEERDKMVEKCEDHRDDSDNSDSYEKLCGGCGGHMHINHPVMIVLVILCILLICCICPLAGYIVGRRRASQGQPNQVYALDPNAGGVISPQPQPVLVQQATPSYNPQQTYHYQQLQPQPQQPQLQQHHA